MLIKSDEKLTSKQNLMYVQKQYDHIEKVKDAV